MNEDRARKTIVTDVVSCARCGFDHKNLAFEELWQPHVEYTHWAKCPTNGQPIMLAVTDEHPYHCIVCGRNLVEAGLGTLACARCHTGYVPTLVDGKVTLHSDVTYEELIDKQQQEDTI